MNPIEDLKTEHEAVRLTLAKLNVLNDGFEKIETDKIGTGRHEAFHRMLDSMKSVYLVKKGGLHDH